jgi:hypothetical protein
VPSVIDEEEADMTPFRVAVMACAVGLVVAGAALATTGGGVVPSRKACSVKPGVMPADPEKQYAERNPWVAKLVKARIEPSSGLSYGAPLCWNPSDPYAEDVYISGTTAGEVAALKRLLSFAKAKHVDTSKIEVVIEPPK